MGFTSSLRMISYWPVMLGFFQVWGWLIFWQNLTCAVLHNAAFKFSGSVSAATALFGGGLLGYLLPCP